MEEGGGHDDVAIDIDDIDHAATSLQNMMSDHLFMSSKCCIFKVPSILYRHNPKAYVPDAFSFGPYHYGKPELKATERIKVRYLQGLVSRLRCERPNAINDFTESIRMVEKDARACYAGPLALDADEFVKVMVLDACFIIELFRKKDGKELRDEDDPIFNMSCMLQFLYHDLILLENQIPWLVLERLYNMTKYPGHKPLVQLVIEFFSYNFSSNPLSTKPLMSENHESMHILDLFRNSLILSAQETKHQELRWKPMPSATSLKEAGIKFKKGTSDCILDIKFNDGVLEIPPLLIQETAEVIFRNLISYEQCYPKCNGRITSYAILLDNLIITEKDMQILCKYKIIDNWLNPEDATQFFNKLYLDTGVKENYYLDIHIQVNEYCQRCWPRNRRVLMRDYFKNPWTFISTMAAVILLILTFLQTFSSIVK